MTCDSALKKYSDMRQGYFLKLTGDMALNKRQRHAKLAFLKIDRRHGDPAVKGPMHAGLRKFLLVLASGRERLCSSLLIPHLEVGQCRNRHSWV